MRRNRQQEAALQAYLRASKRYDLQWQTLTNVQIEVLRNELNDAYKLMSALVNLRTSEGVTAAMRRTYPELRGPELTESHS